MLTRLESVTIEADDLQVEELVSYLPTQITGLHLYKTDNQSIVEVSFFDALTRFPNLRALRVPALDSRGGVSALQTYMKQSKLEWFDLAEIDIADTGHIGIVNLPEHIRTLVLNSLRKVPSDPVTQRYFAYYH